MTSSSRRAVIIYNPVKIGESELRTAVESVAKKYDWARVDWVETTEDEPGETQARAAAAEGTELVIACGGDGTVRSVAAGLHGTRSALGVIPQGTGNLLARNLGISLDLNQSVATAFAGQDREIDFCYADLTRPDGTEESLPFAVMAGVGIDAQMIVNTDDNLKKRFGPLAYAVAIVRSLGGGNRLKVEHQIDNAPFKRTSAHSVIVGNCGELVGSLQLIPDAVPDDGQLDIVIMRPTDLLGWIQITGRLLGQMALKAAQKVLRRSERVTGSGRDIKALRYSTGTTFRAKLASPDEFEVDGDTVGEVTEFAIRIEEPSLVVRVP